jgi:hypothetical protein
MGRIVGAGTMLAALAGLVWWLGPWRGGGDLSGTKHVPEGPAAAGSPEDPRLAYSGPFRNIHPGVKYVGDAACAECHADITATYRRHPMGRSLVPIAAVAPTQLYDEGHHNPFDALGSRFFVERQGDRVWHRQRRLDAAGKVIYEQKVEAHYAIGSGSRGYSYLTSHDGYLFQTPVSWFGQKGLWDLSPGFQLRHVTSRAVDGQCLFCHSNKAHFNDNSLNHFNTPIYSGHAIGCERCHGPGEAHVQGGGRRDRVTKADYTIVNPRRLAPALREAVCQQCHLEGAGRVLRRGRSPYDFRPGLPWASVMTVFVNSADSEEGQKAINHVEQMYQSRCFSRSAGPKQLGCISCHDPHVQVGREERVAYYRQRCLKCHQEQSCTAPTAAIRARANSCIDCHMPHYRAADVAHTASTDHRIPRHPAPKGGAVEAAPAKPAHPGSARLSDPVTLFGGTAIDLSDPELSRDLGIALLVLMMKGRIDPILSSNKALGLLEAATRRDPTDVEAWQAQANVLVLQNKPWPALTAFEAALAKAPERETCIAGAAALAQELHEERRALGYWRRAVAANPWMGIYRANLASLLARTGAWDEAGPETQAWMRLDPESVPARMQWIQCLLRAGNRPEAEVQFALVEALRPPDLDRLRDWFKAQGRAAGAAK